MHKETYRRWMILMALPLAYSCQSPTDQRGWSVAFALPDDSTGQTHLGLAGPVVGVHGDVLLIGGGANFPDGPPWRGNKKAYSKALYAYQQDTEQVRLIDTTQLPFEWAYGANCSTAQGIAIAGGENASGLLNKAMLITWDKEKETPVFTSLPDLPMAVTNASMAVLDHVLYLAGGETADSVSGALLGLDLRYPGSGWQTVGGLPYAVSHACLVAHQHNLYLMGGRKRNSGGVSEFYDGVWRYEVATDRWTARSPLPEPLSAATAVAMGDDDILFMGGDDGGTFRQVERTIAAVTQETDTTRQVGLTQQKIALLENHPGFGGAVLRYDTQDDTWHADSEIAPTAPVTTTAVWWHGNLYLPSGEIRAGIRTPNVWIRKNTANPTNQPIRP